MSWFPYIHHVSLHFPIVGTIVLAIVGIWWVRTDDQRLGIFLRWGGWALFVITTIAMISGLIAASHENTVHPTPLRLVHHRDMGIVVWCIVTTAAASFEIGLRNGSLYLRRFAALCWTAGAFAVIGAAHWGGGLVHSDKIPWDGSRPILARPAEH